MCELGFVILGEGGLPKPFKTAVTCKWMATNCNLKKEKEEDNSAIFI